VTPDVLGPDLGPEAQSDGFSSPTCRVAARLCSWLAVSRQPTSWHSLDELVVALMAAPREDVQGSPQPVTVAGAEGRLVRSSTTENGQHFEAIFVVFLAQGNAWMVSLLAPATDSEAYLPVFQHAIQTLRLPDDVSQ
jgi:hypothetical protein